MVQTTHQEVRGFFWIIMKSSLNSLNENLNLDNLIQCNYSFFSPPAVINIQSAQYKQYSKHPEYKLFLYWIFIFPLLDFVTCFFYIIIDKRIVIIYFFNSRKSFKRSGIIAGIKKNRKVNRAGNRLIVFIILVKKLYPAQSLVKRVFKYVKF